MRRLYSVGIIGCGLIGRKRAKEVVTDQRTFLKAVTDTNSDASVLAAREFQAASVPSWQAILDDARIDIVVVATPNRYLSEITIAALSCGKHVLVEKPMGRNVAEAVAIFEAAKRASTKLKVGFNHRYHPAIAEAHARFENGEIGSVLNIRARYGHGGRAGYEREWRGNPEMAGGGELTDQGVHVADLIHWFAGLPSEAFGMLQTVFWPVAPLEDNAFGLFRFSNGVVASMHTSWTQWKNLFSFEVFGERGTLSVEGLGGSYGEETLTVVHRAPSGGAPRGDVITFGGMDTSWRQEWDDFVSAIALDDPYWGTSDDGLAAMRMIEALYSSSSSKRICKV